MTNAEANRIIAEWVGDEGFSPDRPHYNPHGGEVIATMRGEPKDYCSSLDLTVAAIGKEYRWQLGTNGPEAFMGRAWHLSAGPYAETEGPTPAEALAHAYAQVLAAGKEWA